jgi:arsenite methyltransferase
MVENQAGCCSPSMDAAPGLSESCCSTGSLTSLHQDLTVLLSAYDVNAAAASVKVYAIKPIENTQAACCGPTCC